MILKYKLDLQRLCICACSQCRNLSFLTRHLYLDTWWLRNKRLTRIIGPYLNCFCSIGSIIGPRCIISVLFLVLKGGANNERTLREKVGEVKRKEIKVKNCESEWPRKIRKEKNHRRYFQFNKLEAHSAYSSTLYTCKEMNCERKDPLKLLWEWDLIFPTCTPSTFSNHCNSWLCNQSRDFFLWHNVSITFLLPPESSRAKPVLTNRVQDELYRKSFYHHLKFQELCREQACRALQCDMALLSLKEISVVYWSRQISSL